MQDTQNYRVRKIVNGVISTISGTGVQGSCSDGVLAINCALYSPSNIAVRSIEGVGDEIYIADSSIVRKIGTDGKIYRYAGGGNENIEYGSAVSAQLASPLSVGISPTTGELYIGIGINYIIRKVFLNGTIVSVAEKESSIQGFVSGVTGISFSNTSLYYTEYQARVKQLFLSNGTFSVIGGNLNVMVANYQDNILATDATLLGLKGIAFSPEKNEVYISEYDSFATNGRVRKIGSDGYIVTVAGNLTSLNSGYNGDDIMATDAKLYRPEAVIVSNSGEVIISDTGNSRIRKILSSGKIVTIVGQGNFGNTANYNGDGIPAIAANIKFPSAILLSSSNELYIADFGNYRVRKVLANGKITTIAGTGSNIESTALDLAINVGIGSPIGLAIFGDEVYFTTNSNRVRKILSNGTLIVYAGTGTVGYDSDNVLAVNAKLNAPTFLAVYPNGDLLISDSFNYMIRKVLTNGTIIRVAGTGTFGYNGDNILAINAQLANPQGIHILSNGDILFSDQFNYRVRKILTNGTILTIAGSGTFGYNGENLPALSTQLYAAQGLAVSPIDGSIILADTSNHRIRKILDFCDSNRTCNNNGFCNTTSNQCVCYSGWIGSTCSSFSCEALNNCNGNGKCIGNNTCQCDLGWRGNSQCSQYSCEIYNNCYGNGMCVKNNTCECYSGWRGSSANCSQFSCDGVANCSEHGICTGNNSCSCHSGWKNNQCSEISCDILNNCYGNGICKTNNTCECNSGWKGASNCSLFTCEGVGNCSSHGKCIGNNTCQCDLGWKGNSQCSQFSCEIYNNCNGNGYCKSSNSCECNSGWKGSLDCSQFSCEVVNNCSSHGICYGANTCVCEKGWKGNSQCSRPSCEELQNCNGNGNCTLNGNCSCNSGWEGADCSTISKVIAANESNNNTVTIVVTVVVVVVVLLIIAAIVIIVIAVILSRKYVKKPSNETKHETILKNDFELIDENTNSNTMMSMKPVETIQSTSMNETSIVSDYPSDSFLSSTKVSSIVSSSAKPLTPTNSSSQFSMLKDRYQIQEVIGQGSFGKCFLCLDLKKQNQPVAIKTISIGENKHSKIIDECSKTISYKHPRLVQVYEFFESELLNSICIVMKFYNGDLETLLKKQQGFLPESMIIKMMKQLGDGLDYLHNEKMIIHRDIKPKNIFIESFDIEREEINVVIGDYGEAKDLGETSNTVAGTIIYMAPEVFSRKYDCSADIFSLGVTLVQSMSASGFDFSVTDKLMYEAEESVLQRVSEHLLSRNYSTHLCEFVISMLSRNPKKRPTCLDIKNY